MRFDKMAAAKFGKVLGVGADEIQTGDDVSRVTKIANRMRAEGAHELIVKLVAPVQVHAEDLYADVMRLAGRFGALPDADVTKSLGSMPSDLGDLLNSTLSTLQLIAAQPMPGGPVRSGPVEKHLDGVDLSDRTAGDALIQMLTRIQVNGRGHA